jgi:hypothetical protein
MVNWEGSGGKQRSWPYYYHYYYYYYYYYYYLFKLQMGFYPVAVYYNKTQHTNNTQTNTAHKTTQTIKDTLHTMNTIKTATNTIKTTIKQININKKISIYKILSQYLHERLMKITKNISRGIRCSGRDTKQTHSAHASKRCRYAYCPETETRTFTKPDLHLCTGL